MFRKIVSAVSLSPTLIGRLADYANDLRIKQRLRAAGLIALSLTLVIHIGIVLHPLIPSNTSPDNDFSAQESPAQISSITTVNVSRGSVDAQTTKAQPGDRIAYTVETPNTTEDLRLSIADILEYADVVDGGGSFFDTTNQTLTWFTSTTATSGPMARTFTVKVMDSIPLAARGVSNTNSFDCTIVAGSHTAIHIDIACPPLKQLELAIQALPVMTHTLSLAITVGLFIVSLYFYTRSRQLDTEIRIIRAKINTGAFS